MRVRDAIAVVAFTVSITTATARTPRGARDLEHRRGRAALGALPGYGETADDLRGCVLENFNCTVGTENWQKVCYYPNEEAYPSDCMCAWCSSTCAFENGVDGELRCAREPCFDDPGVPRAPALDFGCGCLVGNSTRTSTNCDCRGEGTMDFGCGCGVGSSAYDRDVNCDCRGVGTKDVGCGCGRDCPPPPPPPPPLGDVGLDALESEVEPEPDFTTERIAALVTGAAAMLLGSVAYQYRADIKAYVATRWGWTSSSPSRTTPRMRNSEGTCDEKHDAASAFIRRAAGFQDV